MRQKLALRQKLVGWVRLASSVSLSDRAKITSRLTVSNAAMVKWYHSWVLFSRPCLITHTPHCLPLLILVMSLLSYSECTDDSPHNPRDDDHLIPSISSSTSRALYA